MQLLTCYNSRRVLQDRRIVSIKVQYKKLYALYPVVTLLVTLGDPEPVCDSDDLDLSVLKKGRFPMQARVLSQRRSASAEVSTPWYRNVHSLVPKCLGAELSEHFGTSAEVSSGHFGTGAEVSW